MSRTIRNRGQSGSNRRLRAALAQGGLSLNSAARLLGLSVSTLQHYWDAYQGEHLPPSKPWAKPLRKLLIARGVPASQVDELFGNATAHRLAQMEREIDAMRSRLAAIQRKIEDDGGK